MHFKRNIWLVFYILIVLGLVYLGLSIHYTWQSIQTRFSSELAFVNRIFSTSVSATFDQQEIMLQLVGQELLVHDDTDAKASRILDQLLAQQKSIVGFGLAAPEGHLIAHSSNIDITKMPNLRTAASSQETFALALQQPSMVLGRTYFLPALNQWVIPIRKSIRNKEGQVLAVMTAGVKPSELLPQLNELTQFDLNQIETSVPFQSYLVHDNSFHYAYLTGDHDHDTLRQLLEQPVSQSFIDSHKSAMQQQYGVTLDQLRQLKVSVEYFAPGADGQSRLNSLIYIPKYRLWSISHLPRQHLLNQLYSSIAYYCFALMIVLVMLYILFRYINNFQERNSQLLRQQANQDFLTGLYNRLHLEYAETQWIHEAAPPFSVIFMDLDNFKNINDSYGHSFGDAILIEVAGRLKTFFDRHSMICRQGGDEFIILSHQHAVDELEQQAQNLVAAISQPYHIDHYHFTIGASIGICRYPQDGASFDQLFSAADTAMYQAKNKKNNYFVFTAEMHQKILKKSNIEQALHVALGDNEFFMVYQPQVTDEETLYGVEALIRWSNKSMGFVPPDQFISVAESSGLILDLGQFIIRQSISDISRIMHQYDQPLRLSINISVRQFLDDGFLDYLSACLKEFNYPANLLTLEITESIFIDDFEYMMPLFESIRDKGISFSLDDFGTGFSSLNMLRNLPIDELKIDKSFIDHITDQPQDWAMVLNILNIASNLDLLVVAEGIETEAQVNMLKQYSCDVLQGYFYSRPIPFDELLTYCEAHCSH